jgi:exoribonuclease-2
VLFRSWSSSPLRRHVDLINQWQLVAHLKGEAPPYTAKSADFLAALRDFELTYAAYADFQRDMERYWCLRWLQQEDLREVEAAFIKEGLARLERIPLVVKTMSLPELPRGKRVRLAIDAIDLLGAEITVRYLESIELPPAAGPDAALGEEGDEEAAG